MKKIITLTLMVVLPSLAFAHSSEPQAATPEPSNAIPSTGTEQVLNEEPEPAASDTFIKVDDIKGESVAAGNAETTFKVEKGEKDSAGSTVGVGNGEPETTEVDAFLRLDDDSDGDGIDDDIAEVELDDDDDDDGEEDSDENHSDWIDVDSVRWGATQGSLAIDDASSFADIDIDDKGGVTISGKEMSEEDRENVRRLFEDNDGEEENVDGRPIEDIALNFGKIDTKSELTEYAGLLAVADENIKQIELQSDAVALEYEYPAKLFWLIPVNYIARIEVDNGGVVKVKFPWWMFLAKDNAKDVRQGFLDELGRDGVVQQYDESDLDFITRLQSQQQTLQAMSNVSKMLHDTAMAVIRKIG